MVDLENLDSVDNINDLLSAVKMLYDPELGISDIKTAEYKVRIKMIAKKLGMLSAVNELFKAYSRTFATNTASGLNVTNGITEETEEWVQDVIKECRLDGKGNVANEIFNYSSIMEHDPAYETVRMNALTKRPEIIREKGGVVELWNKSDDSNSRGYIQRLYNIYSREMHEDGFRRFLGKRSYHPIKEVIEPIKWDGESRIPFILTKWLGVEDSEYAREVARLIFAGGIHRLYEPGCKFDDMAVLIGGQGIGKSTFVRLLAMDDRFYSELTTVDDKKGGELVEGSWIMEVSELLALTKTKEQEEVKAFLSRQNDNFRAAYAPWVESRPRTCIFIGTSNREQFITDKTGGRRFYPVHCNANDRYLHNHRSEFSEYVRQCWAEALAKIDTDFMAPYARVDLLSTIQSKQEDAMEDDYRIGMIQDYLDRFSGDYVCLKMLWDVALDCERIPFSKADQAQLNLLVTNNVHGWERAGRKYISGYGTQRAWRKKQNAQAQKLTYTTPNDRTPF